MTDNKASSNANRKGVNPIIIAAVGAVVTGAAVGGAIIMSDKKNRDKVVKVVSDVKSNLNNKKDSIVNKAKK